MTIRVLLLTLLVLPLSSGCTVLGGLVGATMSSTPSVELHAFDQIPIGSPVEVTLTGGERVTGRVVGYAAGGGSHPPEPAVRPAIGDSVVIADVSGRDVPCVLHGYRRKALAVGCSGMSLEIPYASVREVSWGGGAARDGQSLQELADAGTLPTWGELRLATEEGPRIIRLDQVVRAYKPGRGNYVVLGMAVGMAADVLIGLIALSQIELDFNWDTK